MKNINEVPTTSFDMRAVNVDSQHTHNQSQQPSGSFCRQDIALVVFSKYYVQTAIQKTTA